MIISSDSDNPKETPWEMINLERRKESLQETDWTQMPD